MEFKPTFYEIKLPNKDIKVVVNYADCCNCHFIYAYNGIANTFYGLQCDSFIENVRGLLKVFPAFFENIDNADYRKDLNKMGIYEIPAPEKMKRIYTLTF